MKKTALLVALFAASSSWAFAQYKIVPRDFDSDISSHSGYDWSGYYVGIHAGYGSEKIKSPNSAGFQSIKPKGVMGGIQAGYHYQFDSDFVVGAEAQLSFANIHKEATASEAGGSLHSPYYYSGKVKNMASINGKLGYAIDNLLPYFTAGLTYGKADYGLGCDLQYAANNASNSCSGKPFNTSASKSSLGYNVGVGIEYRMTENLSFGAEYRYTKFKKADIDLHDPNTSGMSRREFKNNMSTLNFSVKYYFPQNY